MLLKFVVRNLDKYTKLYSISHIGKECTGVSILVRPFKDFNSIITRHSTIVTPADLKNFSVADIDLK